MKKLKLKKIISAGIILSTLLITVESFSQERKLPDGSIVYPDGTKRLPNGTVIYKGGNNGTKSYPGNNNGGAVRLPDGTIVYPDGSRTHPNSGDRRREDRNDDDRRGNRHDREDDDNDHDNKRSKHNNGRWLPPGQAKKIYGGEARDYAPGQQKKWKERGHGNGHNKD